MTAKKGDPDEERLPPTGEGKEEKAESAQKNAPPRPARARIKTLTTGRVSQGKTFLSPKKEEEKNSDPRAPEKEGGKSLLWVRALMFLV